MITGASGFLGMSLAVFLSDLGFSVVGLSSSVQGISRATEIIRVDWGDTNSLRVALRQAFCVIHCAALDASACKANPKLARTVNVEYSKTLASLAAEEGVEIFIFTSTVQIYSSELIGTFREGHKPHNNHPYARTKYEAEVQIANALRKSKTKGVCLRLSNVLGAPEQEPEYFNGWHLVQFDFIRQAITTNLIVIREPDKLRDFVSLDVLKSLIVNLINDTSFRKKIGSVINVSSGNSISIYDFAELVCKHLKPAGSIELICSTPRGLRQDNLKIEPAELAKVGFISSNSVDKQLVIIRDWLEKHETTVDK